jgi:serine/threonine-protein kinase haspin
MVLNNGGSDLENYPLYSALEAESIFYQVTLSLAAAEAEYEFEHRDLHWGNILVLPVHDDGDIDYRVMGTEYRVSSRRVLASVIDFTLSRISQDDIVIYDDLSKYDDLFQGSGDFQFEVYRLMREANGNDWRQFKPFTNILWLHYLLDKLLTKKFKSRAKAHVNALKTLRNLKGRVRDFSSASEFVASLGLEVSSKSRE